MLDRNSEQSVDLHQVLWIACQLGGEDCETDVQPLAPAGLQKEPEGKLKAVRQSDAQLDVSMRMMDPADRDGVRTYVRAITNLPGEEGGAASSSKDTKKRRRR